jgi:sugar/nucleoside kinase (ribokinase family)
VIAKKKIAIIGCVNRDTVIQPGRRAITGFGGILYNVFCLSDILRDQAEILPVCNIGADAADQVFELLSEVSNVSTEHMRIVDTENNHCKMTYRDDGERDEIFTGFVSAISGSQLSRIRDADLAVVNFISGRDLTLPTLQRFRESFEGALYLDFHTLSLGLRKDGRRYLRKPKRWREYLQCCDYLQLNAREFSLLSRRPPVEEELIAFFESHVRPTGRALLVTLGELGAAMVGEEELGPTVIFNRACCSTEVIDTTGAGDIFAAAFCAGLIRNCPLEPCLRFAAAASSLGCSFIHPQDFHIQHVLE